MKTLKTYVSTLLVACVVCFAMTGCGSRDNGSTSGNNDNNAVENAADNVGNAAEDVANGAGNAAEDVADGVGNAVDDLVGGNGFDNYDDAHDYFLDTMGNYHADAKFEIRDEDRNLTDYQEGSKGYRFHLYDTSKNAEGDMFGEFYVDAASGTIFQKDKDGKFTEYRGTTANGNTANSTQNGNGATSSTTDNNASSNNKNGNGTTNGGNVSSVR